MKHTVLITGAAGYVGAMLVDQLAKREDVEQIIGLDKDAAPDLIRNNPKLIWLQMNMADSGWEDAAAAQEPDIVIHTAWQIRCFYGDAAKAWKWNVQGTKRVMRFAIETESVKRIVHFSTASVYGAFRDNTLQHYFREDEPMREREYLYGVEKRRAEDDIHALLDGKVDAPKLYIVRPAAITGPRGRAMHHRFGLQSALSGTLKGSFIYSLVKLLVSFVPSTPGWARQFVHEDDVADIVEKLAFDDLPESFAIFNLAPPGPVVLAKDMAQAVGKKTLRVPVLFIRFAYFVFWHATQGRIPTAPGSWRFYSYPVLMDGSKVTEKLGHDYRMQSREAFVRNEGRYAQ